MFLLSSIVGGREGGREGGRDGGILHTNLYYMLQHSNMAPGPLLRQPCILYSRNCTILGLGGGRRELSREEQV